MVEFDDLYYNQKIKLVKSNSKVKLINGNIPNWNVNEAQPIIEQQNFKIALDKDREAGLISHDLLFADELFLKNIHNAIIYSDAVFIDGNYRNLIITVVAQCFGDKIVIVDNNDIESLNFGVQQLINFAYKEIPFHGLSPLNAYGSTTSLYWKINSKLFTLIS